MKRIIALLSLLCCIVLTACEAASIGVIGGADGPTKVFVTKNTDKTKGQFGEQYEKKPVKMFNLDGVLYYDSGLVSDNAMRCGTVDGEFARVVDKFEIPLNGGEANFAAEGYQHATGITKEINIDGKWKIFKRYENLPENLQDYKYCFYISGRLNNAAADCEIVVLTDDKSITLSDVYAPLLSSVKPEADKNVNVSHNRILTGDEWGITLYADNVTAKGMTLKTEQFGGSFDGELQTGAAYELDTTVDDEWLAVETKTDNAVWNSIAYGIAENDITELEVNWELLYGELPPGFYRLRKNITNFRKAGDFDEKTYEVYFTIE